MAMGLGAFTEGLQGGIAARDRMDLNRHLKERLSVQNAEDQLAMEGKREKAYNQYVMVEKGDPEAFNAQWDKYSKPQDPAGIRFLKFLGDKIGFGGAAATAQPAALPTRSAAPEAASSVQTYAMPDRYGYADGGRVKEERGILGRAFSNTADAWDESKARTTESYARTQEEGISPREMGDRSRSYWGDELAGATGVVAGLAKDMAPRLFPGMKESHKEFAGGFVGNDGGGEAANPVPAPTALPEPPSNAPVGDDKAAAAKETIGIPEKDNEQVAQQAVSDAEISAAENFDYKLLADQGIRPEELPSMTTRDWTDYRREQMVALQKTGMSLKEASQEVDYVTVDMQMRGFQREGKKALAYLQTGQNREGAMAIRQAFQYFPNGTSVKFGMATDPKTGLPAIIAMGTDEETGEAAGKPMIITADRLGAMMENMSNPSAFRTWTKDGHELQLEIAKLEEQQTQNRTKTDIDTYVAETGRMNAETDRERVTKAGAGSGMKPSDVDRRSNMYSEWAVQQLLDREIEDPATREGLADAMDRVTNARPDIPPNTVIKAVVDAWTNGGELGVIELLTSLRGE